MQIDQKPGDYRIQRADGSWTQRVNRPMCRWMAIAGMAFMAFGAWKFSTEGGDPTVVLFSAVIGVFVGACLILSLKSTDW